LADDEAARIKALETRLEASLQLIEKLSARVAELERATKAAPAGAAPAAASERDAQQARDITRLQESMDQISAGLGKHEMDAGLPLRGFADVGAAWSTTDDPVRLHGFSIGTLDLYMTPQFGDRVKALAEIAFEFEQGGSGAVEIERLQLGYAVNDALTLWLGRFHTPLGLWNTMFHHGAILQTSISRPRFIDFEDKGGFMPVHAVGIWATGATRLGGGKVSYDGYLANGSSIRERRLDPNAFGDDDSGAMAGFNVGYLPGAGLEGLTLGLHGFASTIKSYTPSGALLGRTRVRAGGAYFGYDANDWEAIGEYYHFANLDGPTGTRYASDAWFAHVGRSFGLLTPYVRFERASLDPDDNYFRAQLSGRSYRRGVVGARYALDPRASLKLELSWTRENGLTQLDDSGGLVPFVGRRYRRTAFQYSIAF
jgi:hypothetical protein